MSINDTKNLKVLVIGVGNRYRSDDGAGLIVAKRLKQTRQKGVRILELDGEATNLIDSWEKTDKVIIVDAISSGNSPGTIKRFDVTEKALPSDLFHYSTHTFSVADALELARTLNKLPKSVVVYGIEGKDFTNGYGLSTEVTAGIDEAVSLISGEIES